MKLSKETFSKYGITIRLVNETDAEFLYALRTDMKLGRFLSKTSGTVADQQEWIKKYKQREQEGKEYYFMAVSQDGERYGTSRLYDFDERSFTVGSWLFFKDAPTGVAIKTDILVREIGFEELGFNFCKFDVRKDNKSVLRYHRAFGPTVIAESELDIYFLLEKDAFYSYRNKLLKI